MLQLQSQLKSLQRHAQELQSLALDVAVHPFKPGDDILVKVYQKEAHKPMWEGPFQILLTGLKVTGKDSLIHYTWCK